MSDTNTSPTSKGRFQPLSNLLNDPSHTDFTIIAGAPPNTQEFRVHRLIISLNSSYFSRACYSPYFTEGKSGEVHLPDYDPVVIKRMIEWLYTGKCNILKEMKELGRYKDDEETYLMKVDELARGIVELEEYADYFGVEGLKEEIARLVPWWVHV